MEREPLVLIHGFTGTPVIWEPVRDRLAAHYELLMPTLLGHCGGARHDPAACGVAALADDLERQLDAAGLETAHVCGNSLGGWLALELAERGRARTVVAISPGGGWDPGSAAEAKVVKFFGRMKRQLPFAAPRARALTSRPRLRKLVMRDMLVHGDRLTPRQAASALEDAASCAIFEDFIAAAQADGPPRAYANIDVPVRIVWGAKDRVLPIAQMDRFRRLLPDAEFVIVEGVGHVPMADDPDRIVAEIRAGTAARQTAPAVS